MEPNEKDFQQERHLFLTVKQVDDQNPNIVHATVSTDEIDRYNEVVQPSAFAEALPAFLANPVVLPAHQHRLENGEPPVIGNVITDTIRISEHQIDLDIEFDTDDLGQKYARKYQKKIMRAFSIGFRGLTGEYKDQDKTRVWIWTKIELLEVSAVAVPANRGALARALGYYETDRADGGSGELMERLLAELAEIKAGVNLCKSLWDRGSVSEDLRMDLEEIKQLLTPDQEGLARELLLGELDDLSDPAGDDIAEQCERIKTILS
jgi:HK97 family phage prohead protease